MGLPLLTEQIANKIWTTMTWAICDGDIPIMQALRSHLGLITAACWRSRSSWGMAWDPKTFKGGSTRAEEYSGTHRWRGGLASVTTGKSLWHNKNLAGKT